MSGKQLISLILGLAMIYQLDSILDSYLDSKNKHIVFDEKQLKEKNRHALEMELLKQQSKMIHSIINE